MTDTDNASSSRRPEDPIPTSVDTDDPGVVRYWCEALGVTIEQLQEAVLAAGTDPAAVRQHFLQQGSSAGAG